ncbi:unnamed protein product, partial [Scytosiphon promiscuus]
MAPAAPVEDLPASALHPILHAFLLECGLSTTAAALREETGRSSKKLAKERTSLGAGCQDLLEIVNGHRRRNAAAAADNDVEEDVEHAKKVKKAKAAAAAAAAVVASSSSSSSSSSSDEE